MHNRYNKHKYLTDTFKHRIVFELAENIPGSIIDHKYGGFLPKDETPTNVSSQIVKELYERHLAKCNRDYRLADLIRKVNTGGDVEIRDTPEGVFWFYGRGR